MLRFLPAFGRVLSAILRSWWFKGFLLLWLTFWLLDRTIWDLTEAAWFASVGQSARFWLQMRWQSGLFLAFLGFAFLAALLVMRAIAPLGNAVPDVLPSALEFLAFYRARVARYSWLILIAAAFLGARGLGSHWLDAALFASGDSNFRAPFLSSVLAGVWRFALILGAVALFAGTLRSLPSLAARRSLIPPALLHLLVNLALTLLFLRALGYGSQIAFQNQATSISIAVLGATLCLLTALLLARKARGGRVIVAALAAFVLPGALQLLVSPFVSIQSSATAKNPFPSPDFSRAVAPQSWPLWDEKRLLEAAQTRFLKSDQRVTRWQSADFQSENSRTRALVAGVAVASQNWNSAHFADAENATQWLFLELPSLEIAPWGVPVAPNFYGLNGATLLNDRADFAAGVPFQSPAWKIAWAWRLRDPLLLLDGAKAPRLLVFRGAKEIAQKLAPFLAWSRPIARRDPKSGAMLWEMVAFEPKFAPNGVLLRIQARDGAVTLHPLSNSNAPWQSLFQISAPQNLPPFAPPPNDDTELIFAPFASEIALTDPIPFEGTLWQSQLENLGNQGAKMGNSTEAGTPFTWRQNGQFLVGRPYFRAVAAPQNASFAPSTPQLETQLAGVAIANEKGEIGVGASVAQALANLESLKIAPENSQTAPEAQTTKALIERALELHKAAQKHAADSQWTQWKRESARENQTLEQALRRESGRN